jgi:hypothetical protein
VLLVLATEADRSQALEDQHIPDQNDSKQEVVAGHLPCLLATP